MVRGMRALGRDDLLTLHRALAAGSGTPDTTAEGRALQLADPAIDGAARHTPVAAATAVTPPRPSAMASLAKNNRRARSSNTGSSRAKRMLRFPTSITITNYRDRHPNDINILILFLCSYGFLIR